MNLRTCNINYNAVRNNWEITPDATL